MKKGTVAFFSAIGGALLAAAGVAQITKHKIADTTKMSEKHFNKRPLFCCISHYIGRGMAKKWQFNKLYTKILGVSSVFAFHITALLHELIFDR